MNGAEILIQCLKNEGVETVFAYPGGTSMLIHQALIGSGIRVVLPRHEQGGAFEANGFARKSGQTGVCIATSGPGATNLVTGIADAWMDSIPLIAITAQVNQKLIGKNAFQETDIIGMTRPIVKHSYLVMNLDELPEIVKDAFALTHSGRPGPVVIDITCDILAATGDPVFPTSPNLRALCLPPSVSESTLDTLRKALIASQKPCIFAGGGIIHSNASAELLAFAEAWKMPVVTSLMGVGAFPENHPLSLRWIGMHGLNGANKTVHECDLLLAIGVRFSDRVTGNINAFAPHAKIIHIDIDDSELDKNKHADLAIVSDARAILTSLMQKRSYYRGRKTWLEQVSSWKKQHEFLVRKHPDGKLSGEEVIKTLYDVTKGEATIVTGVGQHQMWAAQFYKYSHPRQLLTSGGLGAMGFGLPAAIGAKIACPDELVVLVDGDGSFQMNIQELATLFAEGIPLKMLVLNNQCLGMVSQWEDIFYSGSHGNTDLTVPKANGPYPDFVEIAKGYKIPGKTISKQSELLPALHQMLSTEGPFLLNCLTIQHEKVLPLIPNGKTYNDTILK